MSLSRYFAPAVLAASLGFAAVAAPAPAQAQANDLARVLVNVADVVMRGNTPYYRNGNFSHDDRLIAQRDQYGRMVYYRTVPSNQYYGNNSQYYGNNGQGHNNQVYGNSGYGYNSQYYGNNGQGYNGQYYGNNSQYSGGAQPHGVVQPPHGNAYGYQRNTQVSGNRIVKCNKHGKCTTTYYQPGYDNAGYNNNVRHDSNGYRSQNRRWRNRDRDHDD